MEPGVGKLGILGGKKRDPNPLSGRLIAAQSRGIRGTGNQEWGDQNGHRLRCGQEKDRGTITNRTGVGIRHRKSWDVGEWLRRNGDYSSRFGAESKTIKKSVDAFVGTPDSVPE